LKICAYLVQQDYQEVFKNQAKLDVFMAMNDKKTLLEKGQSGIIL